MADLYHLDYEHDRYFLNVIQGFNDGVDDDVELDPDLEFHLKEDDVVVRILRLNLGVLENENPAGVFKYEIHEEVTEFDETLLSGEWVATSGGSPVTPTTVSITADLVPEGTSMAVSSASIADGATDIDPRVEIQIDFDTDLDKDTITRQGFAFIDLRHHNPVDVSITILDDDSVLLRPETGLIENTKYRLVIFSGEINRPWRAVGGEIIQQPYIINFTTGADTYTEVSEVTDPGRIERSAPIRVAPGIADPATAPLFANGSTTWCVTRQALTDTITISFNKDLKVPVDTTRVFVEINAVLGDPMFFADDDGNLFFPDDPETIPVVSLIAESGSDLVITFDEELLFNTAVKVTLTNLEFDDGTFFTGEYKFLTELMPSCATPVQLRTELGGFLSSQFTDCDLEVYSHKNAVDLLLAYGDVVWSGGCARPLHLACKFATVLDLFDDWIARNAAIGQSKQLGDFKVSQIPRPELIIGGAGGAGPYGRKQAQFDLWRKIFLKCAAPMMSANPHINHIDYPADSLRIRTWVLDRQASGANFPRERFTENEQDFPISFLDPLDVRRFS